MTKIDAKHIRKNLNLTLDEMAKKLGVNKSTVWRWEKYGIPNRGGVAYLLQSLTPPQGNSCVGEIQPKVESSNTNSP
ncbi:helix-turn-helix domain-containing protein [Bartonella sp. DGB1]|uniref:helix-turn-helix domain-containing protein n=1 Tax=Bartonella sp. DGB1 TaxID=3239807 RepID=UPI003523F4A0